MRGTSRIISRGVNDWAACGMAQVFLLNYGANICAISPSLEKEGKGGI